MDNNGLVNIFVDIIIIFNYVYADFLKVYYKWPRNRLTVSVNYLDYIINIFTYKRIVEYV